MKDPFYASIFEIESEITRLKEAAVNGVESWDKYNQLVGVARGLQGALDIMNQVLREDEEDNGDRE